MSFRVITYPDPYQLDKTTIWPELNKLPHFCSSSVMAQSLWSLYKGNFESYFWAMDDLTNVVYRDWKQNIELQIAQHAAVSKELRKLSGQEEYTNEVELFEAIEHNKAEFIQSLRLFTELDIDPCSLHEEKANPEQKIFVKLFDQISSGTGELAECFNVSDDKLCGSFDTVLDSLIESSINNETQRKEDNTADSENYIEFRDERIKQLNSIRDQLPYMQCSTIVIHGIHQFQPLQLRLISKLDEIGINIVFMFNYIPEHSHIYGTWHRLYGTLDVPIEHVTVPSIPQNLMRLRKYPTSYEISEAISDLLEAKPDVNKQKRTDWLQLSKISRLMIQFENPTEMANYVSSKLDAIIGQHKSIQTISEKVYSTSKDADNLLKIYYPEYAGGRHFLHYPIGQFFMALYQLWNEDTLTIDIDYYALRECASAGFIGKLPAAEMLELLDNAEVIFDNIKTYNQAIERLNQYINIYKQLVSSNYSHPLAKDFRHISIYNPDMIPLKKAEVLREFIVQLQNTACQLFTVDGKPIRKFTEHFKRLSTMLKDKLPALAEGEEKELINDLLQRFDSGITRTTLDGTMNDLRSGLHYYLKQADISSPEWVVRNFIQIEGDILRSKKQSESAEPPVYHFAGLSDKLMSQRVDDLLPWPLNDYFVQTVYSPNALVFQMYYLSLSEYQDFIRYALFYGLHYNYCPVQLSFVRHNGDEEDNIYYLLQLLGIKAECISTSTKSSNQPKGIVSEKASITFSVKPHEMADFMLCPLKYYFDYATNSEIVFKTSFTIKQFYVNLLIKAAWNRWGGSKFSAEAVQKTISEEQRILDSYFPFLRNVNDKADLSRAAYNYIAFNLVKNGMLSGYLDRHMRVKMLFKTGKYDASDEYVHPYQTFNQLINEIGGTKKVHLYSAISKYNDSSLINTVKDYLCKEESLMPVVGAWCSNCPARDACLEVYYHDKEAWEEV